jgi:hypothetical protein
MEDRSGMIMMLLRLSFPLIHTPSPSTRYLDYRHGQSRTTR